MRYTTPYTVSSMYLSPLYYSSVRVKETEKNGLPTLRGNEKDVSQHNLACQEQSGRTKCYKCCFLKQLFEGYERKW